MKIQRFIRKRGFTLLETVIAIGVLAVLLTGFMYVFAPASEGIKRAINIQAADRLASTLEQELVTLRDGQTPTDAVTGFAKAYDWIKESNTSAEALIIYQYRGDFSSFRKDGSSVPVVTVKDKLAGRDYTLQTMLRRKSDSFFKADLPAVEGEVYYVKCKQLIFEGETLKTGVGGSIVDPKTGTALAGAENYPEAVIAFTADFYSLRNKNPTTFEAALDTAFQKTTNKPVFTRNLAIRR